MSHTSPTVTLTHDDLHPRTNTLSPGAELISSHHYYDLWHTPPYNPKLPGSPGSVHQYTVVDLRERAAGGNRTRLCRTVTLDCALTGELFLVTTATWSPDTVEFDIAVAAAETFTRAVTTGAHGYAPDSGVEHRMCTWGSFDGPVCSQITDGRPDDDRFSPADAVTRTDVYDLEVAGDLSDDPEDYTFDAVNNIGLPVTVRLPGVPSEPLVLVTQPEELSLTTGLTLTRVFARPLSEPTGDPIRIDMQRDTLVDIHTTRTV